MKKIRNPFVTSGYVSAEYFCDRIKESKEVIRKVANGNNLAIISPRRMGKTGLIEHCFHNDEIQQYYYTFFIDIYATGNLNELVFKLGKQIFETLKPKGKMFVENFFSVISSLRPAFKLDSMTGAPAFDIGIGEIKEAEFTLEEIFTYLETAAKPCIVAIDEFQQIAKYPEKNIEAILRTHIQKCKNTTFIFAGSQQHLMQNIFFSNSRPFYQSVSLLPLDAIAMEEYVPFVINLFANDKKQISEELVKKVYCLFEGHTWYLQNIFNELYSLMEINETCSLALVQEAIESKIASYEPMFQSTLYFLSERQKEVLYAIAKDGKATEVTSGGFIKRHGLLSPSSVQASIKQLLDKEIVTSKNNVYQVYDRFFGLWLSKVYGIGYVI
ncbi:MAG: ATP-binding protein [Bacteroidota bacterium]|nr:ATP-binding protein [Bacteroidota bacterium]